MRQPAHRPRTPFGGVAVLRAALATAEIVGFSALAHSQADGVLPAPDELLWVALGVFAATALLLGGRLRVRTVVGLCTALQIGLHYSYTSLGHGRMADMPAMHAVPSHAMVVAHTASAVVTTLVLLVQDQAVRRLAGVAGIEPVVAPVVLRAPGFVRVAQHRATVDLLRVAPTRGPPLGPSPMTS